MSEELASPVTTQSQNLEHIVELSLEAGQCLLENGAETYRVEESVSRILLAYGIKSPQVFAIPSCLIVTASNQDKTAEAVTRMRRIVNRGTNLGRVSSLNNICRKICANMPDCLVAKDEIFEIASSSKYNFWIQLFAFSLISFAFTLFFGGGIVDALCAILCGAVLKCALFGMERLRTNWFFVGIAGSAVVAILGFALTSIGILQKMDTLIIGTLMNLVPGVALTNGMRDVIAGDLLSGVLKLAEALMTAASIALGSGIAIFALRMLLGGA